MGDGVYGEGRHALETKLVHDVTTVSDDRAKTDVQKVGNLLVDVALYDERHDLNLTVGENFTLQHLRHGRHVLATAVGVLL